MVSPCSIFAWSKSHSESFLHSLGLHEKLFAFASHFLQAEQGISELLLIPIVNMSLRIDLSVMKRQLRVPILIQNFTKPRN